jgi:hypothetical protein
MPILAGLALALGLFALYVASRPAAFCITRSLVMSAPPAAIFPLINDFREWAKWSPWEKLDPNMKKTYDGAESGVGAAYHWVGDKSGEGKMTLTESVAHRRVVLDLNFIKPFPANNTTVFTLEPEGEGTRVTWTMEGQNSFVAKAFNVVMNMDKLVGRDFESGLAAMASAATR